MKLGTQVWGLITVVVVLALVAGGYFLGAAPLLDAQAKSESARKEAVAANETLQADINRLKLAEEDLDEYVSVAAELEQLIPDTVDSQRYIRQLNAIAAAAGVTISEITIDNFLTYSPQGGDGTETDAAPAPYTDGRINDENFVVVPLTVTVEGGWNEAVNFMHGVQYGDRLVLVQGIETTTTDTAFSTKISGVMYVLVRPDTPAPGSDPEDEATEAADGENATARG